MVEGMVEPMANYKVGKTGRKMSKSEVGERRWEVVNCMLVHVWGVREEGRWSKVKEGLSISRNVRKGRGT